MAKNRIEDPTPLTASAKSPATSPGILGSLASLVGLGGSSVQRHEEVPAASAPSAPPATNLPDEPNSAVAGVDQSVASGSGSAPTGEPTVSAVEDREPPAPLQDVGLVPLPASSSGDDFWEDASHLRGGQSAAQAPAPVSAASAPSPALSRVFDVLAAGYNAGRNGEALPGVTPAAQAAPAQSTPYSTGFFGRFTSALRISASNGAEVPAAVAPSPSASPETPVRTPSIVEALTRGFREGSTPKPVTPPADTSSPADTASFVARLQGERAAGSSPSI